MRKETYEALRFMDEICYGLRAQRFEDADDAALVEGARLVREGRKVHFSFTIADGHLLDVKATDAGPLVAKDREP